MHDTTAWYEHTYITEPCPFTYDDTYMMQIKFVDIG